MRTPPAALLAAVFLSILTPTAASAQARLFLDDFQRTTGLGPNWQLYRGVFTTDGANAVSGTPTSSSGNWATALPTPDYSVSADVILPAGSRYSGIVARSNDPASFSRNLYAAQLATNGTVNLYRRNEWSWTLLQSVAAGIVADRKYALKLVVTGYDPAVHLEVWVDGTQRISFNDADPLRIAGGAAGVVCYDPGVKYANFAVDAGTTRAFSDSLARTTGLGSNWFVSSGSFTTDGAYAVSGAPAGSSNFAKVVPVYGTNDYAVTANVAIPVGSSFSGIVARSDDPVNFSRNVYAAQLASNGYVNLYRRNEWNWTLLRGVPAGITAGTAYALKLVVSGYDPAVHLEVWVNGTRWISEDDASASRIATGAAGMENYDAGVRYASFTIDTLGSTPPPPPPPSTYDLNVSVTGNGTGAVTSDPAGIDCGTSCEWAYASGIQVTLTATPDADSSFAGWTGDCTGVGECVLDMSANRSVSAEFASNTAPPPTKYEVAVTVTGNGTVTSSPAGIKCGSLGTDCSVSFDSGTEVTLTATADTGHTFQGWGEACTGTGTCSPSITADRSVSAEFRPNQKYPCGDVPCARGQFPAASWRPYADSSPFNTKVEHLIGDPNAPLIASTYCSSVPNGSTCSAEIVKRILRRTQDGGISINPYPAHWLIATNGMTGWPTYYGTSTDPTFSVTCNEFLQPGQTNSCPAMELGRAPGGAVVQGAGSPLGGTDRHLTFIDQDKGFEFDLWHVQPTSLPYNGGTITTGYSGYTTITEDGRSLYGEGNAGRFGNLAGRIRIEEMTDAVERRTYINHALTVAINCTSGRWIYPANGNVGRACTEIGLANGNAPPMGAHLHLDMSLDEINALATVPEWKKVLLRTLAVYGAYVNDTGTDFSFAWQLESGVQYTSMGVSDPWLAFASSLTTSTGANDWWDWSDEYGSGYKGLWNTSNGISWDTQVWARLRVLAQ